MQLVVSFWQSLSILIIHFTLDFIFRPVRQNVRLFHFFFFFNIHFSLTRTIFIV